MDEPDTLSCHSSAPPGTCPKYILAPLFRVMHYEWAALTKEVCFSNQFKLLNFSALHVLPCEPCSVTWREGSAIDRCAGPQTTEDMLSESPRCNDMVADLHFPRFFGTAIQCEIARRFPRSVVKSRSQHSMQKYQYFEWGSTLNLENVQSQRNVYCYYNNVLLIPSPESPTTLPRTSCW